MSFFAEKLIELKDENLASFTKKLTPTTNQPILGVSVPKLKQLAKTVVKTNKAEAIKFLSEKHTYFEETFLHGLIIGELNESIDSTITMLNDFIPQIDNWAICDSVVASVKILKKNPEQAFSFATNCFKSNKTYTIRFGIVLIIFSFDKIREKFGKKIYNVVLSINSDEYYVNMALAWFYSVALVKDYHFAIKILEEKVLPKFIQNKAIQKAKESFRIDTNKKSYLTTLKIR